MVTTAPGQEKRYGCGLTMGINGSYVILRIPRHENNHSELKKIIVPR
jgi:hypothetical protein